MTTSHCIRYKVICTLSEILTHNQNPVFNTMAVFPSIKVA